MGGVFGYVKPFQSDLLVRENDFYRAAYCGLCRAMHSETGFFSRFALRYDLLLLALMRLLYEPDKTVSVKRRRCIAHPMQKRQIMEKNPALSYAAKVSALLSYYHIKDNRKDTHGIKKLAATVLMPAFGRCRRKAKMPELDRMIVSHLNDLEALQEQGCRSADEAAETFGALLGDVFAFGLSGDDARVSFVFGHGIGRFIYIADAAEDYKKDKSENTYNPFVCQYGQDEMTDEQKQTVYTALLLELERVESAMNLLPNENCDAVIHIIQNTVYEGLPRRIEFLRKKVSEEKQMPETTLTENERKDTE